jgi:hypothetical protein
MCWLVEAVLVTLGAEAVHVEAVEGQLVAVEAVFIEAVEEVLIEALEARRPVAATTRVRIIVLRDGRCPTMLGHDQRELHHGRRGPADAHPPVGQPSGATCACCGSLARAAAGGLPRKSACEQDTWIVLCDAPRASCRARPRLNAVMDDSLTPARAGG